jgi:Ca2+/Na+ antiporter
LSGAIFAATVVPTLLALLAWGALYALDELDPSLNAGTAGFFLVLTLFYFPVLTRPAIIALGASAAIYGVFALAVYRAQRKAKREAETTETIENAEVEAAENE